MPKKEKPESVQPPHYTMIPNVFLDNLDAYTPQETKVLLTIARYTFGFQMRKTTRPMSYSVLAEKTGLAKSTVQKAIESLKESGVLRIHKSRTKGGMPINRYSLNVEKAEARIVAESIPGDGTVSDESIPGDGTLSEKSIPGDGTLSAKSIPGDGTMERKEIERKRNKNKRARARASDASVIDSSSSSEKPTTDPDIAKVYEETWGLAITKFLADSLDEYVEEFGYDVVVEGLQICAKRNVRTFKYLEGVMRNLQAQGKSGNVKKTKKREQPKKVIQVKNAYGEVREVEI